jgi:tetratricopeptide (TPR) repeat protein
MGFLSSLTGLFTGGSEDSRLIKGMDLAKAGKPEKAIEIYNALMTNSSSDTIKARAKFNRALAHSAMKNDELALKDLQEVLSMPNLPENVQSAARSQLARVRKRSE